MRRFGVLAWVFAALWVSGCSAGRSEGLTCSQKEPCPDGMRCGERGRCELVESASAAASARGTASGAPVAVSVVRADGSSCEQGACSDLPLGSRVTFRAPSAAGFRFVRWSGSAECRGTELDLVIASLEQDTECVAEYVRRVRVSAVDPEGLGEVEASSDSPFASCALGACEVDTGSSVLLHAAPRAGVRFEGWSGGVACVSGEAMLPIVAAQEDVTCSAQYGLRPTVSAALENASEPAIVEASGATAECGAGRCSVDPGDSVAVFAPARAGFRFVGWSGSARCTGASARLDIVDVRESEACLGRYVARRTAIGSAEGPLPPPSVVALSDDSFALCEDGRCEVDSGGAVTLIAPSAPGYRLSGWLGPLCSGQVASIVRLAPIEEDTVCVAQYTEGIAVSGALIGAEGEVLASSPSPLASCAQGSCTIEPGGSVTLTAPSLADRRFLGWEGDPGCATAAQRLQLTDVQESRTCYARYAARYRVAGSASPSAGGSVLASSPDAAASCMENACAADAGAEVTLTAQPATGFRFAGWTGGGECAGQSAALLIPELAGNLTCTANFVGRLTVSAVVEPSGGGSVLVSSQASAASCSGASCALDHGASATLVASAAPGYRFTGWSECMEATSPAITLSRIERSVTCRAQFAPLRFSVVGTVAAGVGSVSASSSAEDAACTAASCTVSHGSPVSLTATAGAGHQFAGWSGCRESAERTLSWASVVADTACSASFSPLRFDVTGTVSPAAAGTIRASSDSAGAVCQGARCTVAQGSAVLLVATPAAGQRFMSWSGCATSSAESLTLPSVEASANCQANFVGARVTIAGSAAPPAGGTVVAESSAPDASCEGAGCDLPFAAPASLLAQPSAGYRFTGWSDCGASSEALRSWPSVTAPVHCTANFERLTFTVAGAASPATAGSVVASIGTSACVGGSCTVPFGGAASLRAAPLPGFRFLGWAGCSTSAVNPLLLTNIQANTSCTARFVADVHTFTVARAGTLGSVSISTPAPVCSGPTCTRSVAPGTIVTFAASPAAGYVFQRWSGTGCTATTQRATLAVNRDVTCTANFVRTFTVSARAGELSLAAEDYEELPAVLARIATATATGDGSSCIGARCTVVAGESVTFTVTGSSSWQFSKWDCTGIEHDAGTRSLTVSAVVANVACWAVFVPAPPR